MSGLLLCIVGRELKGLVRRKGFYRGRLLAVLVMGGLVVGGQCVAALHDTSGMGLFLFSGVVVFLLFLACIAAPCAAAPGMAREYEEGTISLVRLAGARVGELAAGKWMAALIRMVLLVLAGLPIVILCVSLGGVSSEQVLQGLVVVFGALVVACSLGFSVGAACRTEWSAMVLSLIAAILWFVGLPLAFLHWDRQSIMWREVLPVIAPGSAMADILAGRETPMVVWYGLFSVLMGLGLLGAGMGIASVGAYMEGRLFSHGTWRQSVHRGSMRGNPLSWHECPEWHGGVGTWGLTLLVSIIVPVTPTLLGNNRLMSDLLEDASGNRGMSGIFALTMVAGTIFAARVILGCASALAGERQERTLELLMLSPLSERDVVLGKLWGQVRSGLPWLWVTLGTWCMLWLRDCDVLPYPGCAVVGYIAGVLASACYTLFISFRWGRVAATVSAITVMVLATGGAILSGLSPWMAVLWVAVSLALADFHLGKLMYRYRCLRQLDVAWAR